MRCVSWSTSCRAQNKCTTVLFGMWKLGPYYLLVIYAHSVRQLLYYPFTPFFSLLGNIISDPHSPGTHSDLSLLRLALSYFVAMDKIYQHARKLKVVAEIFCELAEAYVSRARSNGTSASAHKPLEAAASEDPYRQFHERAIRARATKTADSHPRIKPSTPSMISDVQNNVALNDLPVDPAHILDLFSVPAPTTAPADSSLSTGMPLDIGFDNFQFDESLPGSEMDLMYSLQTKVFHRPMEGTFDWFSWDKYNRDELDGSGNT